MRVWGDTIKSSKKKSIMFVIAGFSNMYFAL